MYVPDHFRLPDEHLRALLRTPRAGNLVTVHEGGPDATLVPFYLDEQADCLVTHLVRNNPQATRPVTGPAMVVLDVADAYVSPRWYASFDTSPSVPTWDYLAIHVWGPLRLDHSPEAALAAARQLTDGFEDDGVLTAVGEEQLARLARSIVRVEVPLERVEGKAKMSQNRHPDDVRSVARALAEQGEHELADYLERTSLPHALARHGLVTDLRRRHQDLATGARPAHPDEAEGGVEGRSH